MTKHRLKNVDSRTRNRSEDKRSCSCLVRSQQQQVNKKSNRERKQGITRAHSLGLGKGTQALFGGFGPLGTGH